jgi:hypothetical protein
MTPLDSVMKGDRLPRRKAGIARPDEAATHRRVSAGGNLGGTGMDVNLIPDQIALHKANLRSVRGRLKDAFDIGTAERDLREPGRYPVAGAVREILGFQDGASKTFHGEASRGKS